MPPHDSDQAAIKRLASLLPTIDVRVVVAERSNESHGCQAVLPKTIQESRLV